MRSSMLTNDQMLFIQEEKLLLTDALRHYDRLGLPPATLDALQKAITQLDELFLLVVVGEFNAGKSALINALLGEKVLREGVTPTTARVTLVRYGEEKGEQVVDGGFAIYTHPMALLQQLNVVDSPGTNAILREHELLTNEFVPRSDLVLFVTSADRAMTESERQFLEKILAWGKKVVFVVNKADILETEGNRLELRDFVMDAAQKMLGVRPQFFMVSARLAQQAALAADPMEKARLRAESGLDELESYITKTLDDSARLELKLRNPLGVLDHLTQEAEANNLAQAADLEADSRVVDHLEAITTQYEKELSSELGPRLAEVENVLQRFELRGQTFFDDTFRIANIGTLAKADKVRSKFESEVMADVSGEIEEKVHNLINWLVDKDLHTWYQVAGELEKRQAASNKVLPSGQESPQSHERAELIRSVGATIKNVIGSYDRVHEAEQVNLLVKDTVAQTALFEAGALGIGALVATVFATRALDVTGIVAAGTLAILGFFVIPFKRKQAKENFSEKMRELRENLMSTLRETFDQETDKALLRLRDKIAPYTQYVHEEQHKIAEEALTLQSIRERLTHLTERVPGIASGKRNA